MAQRSPSNFDIAGVLNEIADLLEAKGENIYRVNSYRNAARSVEVSSLPVASIARKDGIDGIQREVHRHVLEYSDCASTGKDR